MGDNMRIKQLSLNQEQADRLIEMVKLLLDNYGINLKKQTQGSMELTDNLEIHHFKLWYKYALGNCHITLSYIDCVPILTLVRINLDSRFHNNSDGRVWGNRIEIFNEQEFYDKADSFTHYKAYKLPYKGIRDTNKFVTIIKDFFRFTHIEGYTTFPFYLQEELSE